MLLHTDYALSSLVGASCARVLPRRRWLVEDSRRACTSQIPVSDLMLSFGAGLVISFLPLFFVNESVGGVELQALVCGTA